MSSLLSQLVISEIRDSAATALQAVKLLAQYLSCKKAKVFFCALANCSGMQCRLLAES